MKRLPTLSGRTRLALGFGFGGAMILLPMSQVLRYQSADLRELAAQRAALDPLSIVVGVQRGVLAHRDTADRVLRGRSALESERRDRQAELDERLRHLQDTLTAGWWLRALQESQSLTGDWRQLARRVALRQIQPPASLDAHQLLMEQAVQVLDLVQAAAPSVTGALVAQATHQLHQRRDLPTAEQQQALAALEGALLAADTALMTREADVREQRAAVWCALGALLAVGLGFGVHLALRGRHTTEPGGTGPTLPAVREDSEQRRSHGRRATDAAPQRDEAAPLLQRLRSGDLPSTSEPR